MARFSGKFDRVAVLLSTGRTGTMALAHYMDEAYSDVRALHEPRPCRHLRFLSNLHLAGKVSGRTLVDIYAASRRRLFKRTDQPIYVESNNFLHGYLDVMDEMFDAPRIVHIVRDPRTFVRSWINFGVFAGLKGFVVKNVPYWLCKPELLEDNPPKRWNQMLPVERIAWYWSRLNGQLDRGRELFGDRYIRLRFEDVFAPDGQTLAELIDWLDLPPRPGLVEQSRSRRVNASKEGGFPKYPDWPAEWKRILHDYCGKQMAEYGYEPDPAGDESGREVSSSPANR